MLETKLIYKIFLSISHFFNISIFIFLLMMITKIQHNQIKDNSYINDLIQNWFNRGIKEIYVPSRGEKCESYLFTRNWEGLDPVCDCRKSFYNGNRYLYKGKCSIIRLISGCRSINGADQHFTNKWKGSELCVKHTDTNYFDTITVIDAQCPKKYILCGVDSKNFGLCLHKNKGCPVNKLKITNNLVPTPNDKKHFHSFKLNDDWYFHYSNSFVNETFPIDVKYSEGRICINPSETNLKLSYIKYKKELNTNASANFTLPSYCPTKIGKFNYDERYKNLDSVSKFKYYFDNDIIQRIENLPQINSQELINYNVYLYQRGYIYWSPYCRNDPNMKPEKIVDDVLEIIKIESYFDFVAVFILIIFISYILLVISDSILRFNVVNLEDRNKILYHNIYKILVEAFLIVSMSLIILLILVIYILITHKNIHKKFNDLKCGDYFTNIAFNEAGKNLYDVLYYGAELLLGSVILFTGLIVSKLIL